MVVMEGMFVAVLAELTVVEEWLMAFDGKVVVDSVMKGMVVVVVEGTVRGMVELGLIGVAELTVLVE
jgi:cephalosporin hydroxylase